VNDALRSHSVDLDLQRSDSKIGSSSNGTLDRLSILALAVYPLTISVAAAATESLIALVALAFCMMTVIGLVSAQRLGATRWREYAAATRGRLTIADEGLRFENDERTSTVRWRAIARIDNPVGRIAVYSGDRLLFLIPHRCFADTEHREQFERALRERVGQTSGKS
jgi:hypothetical protein